MSVRSPCRQEAEDMSEHCLRETMRVLWTHLIWAGWEASLLRRVGVDTDGSFARDWKMVSSRWQLLSLPQFLSTLSACTDAFSVMMLFGPHLLRFSMPSHPLTIVFGTSGKTNHA